MVDLRPVAYVIGRILIVLAILMLAPAMIDWRAGLENWTAFLSSAVITGVVGASLTLSTSNALGQSMDTRQAYLLTAGIWALVPLFGAIPFYIGAPGLGLNNAYFEAVSGITTTGATVIVGLDDLPAGMNLWRGMLNWLGGLGIAFIAMIFLPIMRVGGMQFFRTEGFDTFGKALPRATDIARQLLTIRQQLLEVSGGRRVFRCALHGAVRLALHPLRATPERLGPAAVAGPAGPGLPALADCGRAGGDPLAGHDRRSGS
jgi:trk system potassium uptake protein